MTGYSMFEKQNENSTGEMHNKRLYSVDKLVRLYKILIVDFLILVVNFVEIVFITLKISKQVWMFTT